MDALDLALLNDHQRGFPLVARPFAALARQHGISETDAIGRFARLAREGALGRIGAVWAPGAGGAAALCALAVSGDRLEAVADAVSRHPGVNHNYAREHAWNLWFVVTDRHAAAVRATVASIEAETGLDALVLPMLRAYRIDLGFDLGAPLAAAQAARPDGDEAPMRVPPVRPADEPLAALASLGLAFVAEPFARWAAATGLGVDRVLDRIAAWLAAGTLRRFGVVVRHHDVGIGCNAMTVIDAPDAQADAIGLALARQPGVTLAYRRVRDPRWPYNVYCMVHGRERKAVRAAVEAALAASGADRLPHAVLFSTRRFKQTGARYFGAAPAEALP
jgi:DNA-binding Lrp family transcriptional regulator